MAAAGGTSDISDMDESENEAEETEPVVFNPNLKEIKDENNKMPCSFCHSPQVNELEYGVMYQFQHLTVHYFCMLFSCGLKQNGADNEGILGFMPNDIDKELKRGKKLKCRYCKKSGTTVGCIVKKCPSSFHVTCGLRQGTLHSFTGQYSSYCKSHKPKVHIPVPQDEWHCLICYCDVEIGESPLWSPCCKTRVFHRECVQRFALTTGSYHLKCPNCKNENEFVEAMKQSGVYVPDRDAAWELERAFADQEQQYSHCDAESCFREDGGDENGRNVDLTDDPNYRIVRCGTCGSQAVHIICGQVVKDLWQCPGCEEIDRRASFPSGTKINERDGSSEKEDSQEENSNDDPEDDHETEIFEDARYRLKVKSTLVGIERKVETESQPIDFVDEPSHTTKHTITEHPLLSRARFRRDSAVIVNISSDSDSDFENDSSLEKDFKDSEGKSTDAEATFNSQFFKDKFQRLKISCSKTETAQLSEEDTKIPEYWRPGNLNLDSHYGRLSAAYTEGAVSIEDNSEIVIVKEVTQPLENNNEPGCSHWNSQKGKLLPERYRNFQRKIRKGSSREGSLRPSLFSSSVVPQERSKTDDESGSSLATDNRVPNPEAVDLKSSCDMDFNSRMEVSTSQNTDDDIEVICDTRTTLRSTGTQVDLITLSDSETESGEGASTGSTVARTVDQNGDDVMVIDDAATPTCATPESGYWTPNRSGGRPQQKLSSSSKRMRSESPEVLFCSKQLKYS